MASNRRLKKLVGKPVLVDWVDAVSFRGWATPEELASTRTHLRAVGILALVRRDRIALSIGDDPGSSKCACLVLPREMVLRVRHLRPLRRGK